MKLENVTKILNEKKVLNRINFELAPGEIVGLVGRNGSGKTTIFRTITNQYQLDEGTISINNRSLTDYPEERQQIFYIDEKDNFLSFYNLKNINDFYRFAYPNFDQDFFLNLIQDSQFSLQWNFRQLSKGMQGLFLMILALSSNAKYVLLDEPFDGLDVIVRKKVVGLLLENLNETPRGILITSHNLTELENIVDRVLLIKGNTISENYQLETIREQAKKIQFVFRSKTVPQIIKEHSKALKFHGRVITAVFEDFTPELALKIKELDPIFYEELPLTLEDLFEANLRTEEI